MKRNNVLRNTQGFTLVELAIVLVIIGLIIGGVLKGRELITSGKVKSTANQLTAVSAATESYKDKFKNLAFPNISSMQSQGFLTGSAGMKNKFGGDVFTAKNVSFGGKTYSAVVSTALPGDIAQMVDEQLDDGKVASGTVVVVDNTVTPLTPTSITSYTIATLLDSTYAGKADTAILYLY